MSLARSLAGLWLAFVLAGIPVAAQSAAEGLTLRPGDVIQLKILREPGLSGDYLVNDAGAAMLPLIGTQPVTGMPWGRLRDSLRVLFARELRDPDIGLVPLRRVYVLGSVEKPGLYFVDPLGTYGLAVAMAGGVLSDGDPSRLRVVRAGRTLVERTSIEALLTDVSVASGDQIFVERRSWFDRNSAAVIGAGAGLLGVIATLLVIR